MRWVDNCSFVTCVPLPVGRFIHIARIGISHINVQTQVPRGMHHIPVPADPSIMVGC